MRGLLVYLAPLLLVELRRAIPELLGLERFGPDPVLIAVVFAALRFKPEPACFFAAVCGLLGDVPAGTPFGLGGARLALVAALVGSLKRQVDPRAPLVPLLCVLFASLFDRALAAVILDASSDTALRGLLARGALDALATALVVPLLWPAFQVASPRQEREPLAGRRALA